MQLQFLVPAYNSEDTILETLESLRKNTKDAQETIKILVSNNNSTDSTEEVVQKFSDSLDNSTLDVILRNQTSNLGCYGNMHYLQKAAEADWGYVLCADDTFNGGALELILAEIERVDERVSLIAFRDDSNHAMREPVEKANGSKVISGKRGLALFFLFGCFIGSLSTICLRTPPQSSSSVSFDPSFRMSGDFNFYVDLLLSGGAIYLSSSETTYYRPGSPAAAASIDIPHYLEEKTIYNKCIDSLAATALAKVFLRLYLHAVAHNQYYRHAVKRILLKGKFTAFRRISAHSTGGTLQCAFFCLISVPFFLPPVRNALRNLYVLIML